MFILYQFCVFLATPLICLYWWKRSLRDKRYSQRLSERFGYYQDVDNVDVWLHAASMGEARLAAQVVVMLARFNLSCVVTTQTPTGLALLQSKLSGVICAHAPLDRYDCVSRFLAAFKPRYCFLIETEIWPGWIRQCKNRHIPIWVLNARCHYKKFVSYKRLQIIWPFIKDLTGIVAVDDSDADAYRRLGVKNTQTIKNLKWAVPLQKSIETKTPLICAGSFHQKEIFELLKLWQQSDLRKRTKLVIAPRHLDYLNEIDDFMHKHQMSDINDKDECGIAITRQMGVLTKVYQKAQIAILGGSFIEHGGQNPLEPAACGKPVLIGPSTYNFDQPVRLLKQAGALQQCSNMEHLMRVCTALIADSAKRQSMGVAARSVMTLHQSINDQYICVLEKIVEGKTCEANT